MKNPLSTSLDLSDVARIRIINQQLAGTDLKTGTEMTEWFGAVQGQEYAQTKWGLGLRLPHIKDTDIERELTEGSMLRTHLLRPTWHFVSANDIRWLLLLTAPRVQIVNRYMYRKLDLDTSVFNRCNDIMTNLLQGNAYRTRDKINEEFKRNNINAKGHRLGYIMMNAELEGIICSGPRHGKQFTYALLDERAPSSTIMTRDEALAELTKRYFTSRGPATLHDFSTWSGLTLTECKEGVHMEKQRFTEITADNLQYYVDTSSPGYSEGRSGRPPDLNKTWLLPVYDELLMGYKHREAFMQYHRSIQPLPEFRYDCTIVHNGQITGTWKRTVKTKSAALEYEFFQPPDDAQWNGFKNSIQRFEKFTGLTVKIERYNKV